MSDLSPETLTDEQVNSFFDSGGNIGDKQPEIKQESVKSEVDDTEPSADAKQETEQAKEEKKVNYGALHEERSRRKAEQERAEKAEERAAELERQLQKYIQPRQEPNFDDDPLEAVKQKQQLFEKISYSRKPIKRNSKPRTRKYWARVKESEIAYKQDHPDFDDAIKYLADSRKEELRDLGWSDEEASKVLADEIKWIADKAYADEVNPAERFHNLAKRRGYKSAPKEDMSADEKLDIIKKGMQTNRQLPPASKSVKQDLTLEALADMKVDALSGLYAKTDFDKAWDKLFG